MTDEHSLSDEDIDRLTNDTFANGQIPDRYTVVEQADSIGTLFETGVMIERPQYKDTTVTIHPEDVPARGTPSLDFFYGEPRLHLYDPLKEEAQYSFKLPTKEHPELEVTKIPQRR